MDKEEKLFHLASKIYTDAINTREDSLDRQVQSSAADDAKHSVRLAQIFLAEYEKVPQP